MKHITLLTVEFKDGTPFSYREQLVNLVTLPQSDKGFSIDEVKKRLRLLDVLEGCEDGDVAAFEDADHELLVKIVDEARWARASRELVQFVEDVREGADSLPQIGASNGQVKEAVSA